MKPIAAIVAGTGFEGRDDIIRRHCREGAAVELRREPNNPHDPNAIAVWLRCSSWFGLVRTLRQIGYVKAERAVGLARRLDEGSATVASCTVRSFYAPPGREHPRVSLEIVLHVGS